MFCKNENLVPNILTKPLEHAAFENVRRSLELALQKMLSKGGHCKIVKVRLSLSDFKGC